MSKLKSGRTKKKLRQMLQYAGLESFFEMVWAVDAIATKRSEAAHRFFEFPVEANQQDIGSKYFIPRWSLETLLNEFLTTPLKKNRHKTLNCNNWNVFAELANTLRTLEDQEDMLDVNPEDIAESIPRILWRQSPWQIGFSNDMEIYRAWSLYNSEAANSVLFAKYELSFDEITFIGRLLYDLFLENPSLPCDINLSHRGISNASRDNFFSMVSLSSQSMQAAAYRKRKGVDAVAYKPSILRNFPLIKVKDGESSRISCPIPDLLLLRISSGLFYDIVENNGARNAAGSAFEKHILEFTRFHFLPHFSIDEEFEYKNRGSKRSVDMIVSNEEGQLKLVVECKALSLKMHVRQSPDPWNAHSEDFRELIKGILQIWRFCHQAHLKKFEKYHANLTGTVGIILTLHPWVEMSAKTTKEIVDKAKEAATKENIPLISQIPVSFVASTDWETSLQDVNPTAFLKALHIHTDEKKYGYLLHGIAREILDAEPNTRAKRKFSYFKKPPEAPS